MSEIRPLTAEEAAGLSAINTNAYPAMVPRTAEGLARAHERALEGLTGPGQWLGLFRDGKLAGAMNLWDFRMNFAGLSLPVGGVGGVAVDLLRKKEHVAKELITYYLDHYQRQGTYLAALYPFRPDFYRRMGFGYGTRMHEYRLRPAGLPQAQGKAHLQFLSEADLDKIHACYDRFFQRRHGLFARSLADVDRAWRRPAQQLIGYLDGAQVRGYLMFSFKPSNEDNILRNNLLIHELVYDDAAVLHEFLAFLHSQSDQIDRIVYSTQDRDFYHVVDDPRNQRDNLFPIIALETNIQGLGLMYRVIDVPGLLGQLADHDFGGQTITLALTLADSFRPGNEGRWLIRFDAGRPALLTKGTADVEMALGIAAFSSLLVGAVSLPALTRLGLATIDDEAYGAQLARLFALPAAPICLTPF